MAVTFLDTPEALPCPACGQPLALAGQMVNCLDAQGGEWHWECAEAALALVPARAAPPPEPMLLDGMAFHLPGCPGCGGQLYNVNSEDHFIDRGERWWHWECLQRALAYSGSAGCNEIWRRRDD